MSIARVFALITLIVASVGCHGSRAGTAPVENTAMEPRRAGAAIAVGREPRVMVSGPITPASLSELLRRRFQRQLADGTFTDEWNGTDRDVLAEIAAMGWTDLSDVARAIPDDFDTRAAIQFRLDDPANMPGLLRDFMIMSNPHQYFGIAWQDHWGSLARGDAEVYRAYGIDLEPLRAAGVMEGP